MHNKKVCHSWNVPTLQLFLGSVLNTIVLVLNFNFVRVTVIDGSIFHSFRQEKYCRVVLLKRVQRSEGK